MTCTRRLDDSDAADRRRGKGGVRSVRLRLLLHAEELHVLERRGGAAGNENVRTASPLCATKSGRAQALRALSTTLKDLGIAALVLTAISFRQLLKHTVAAFCVG